MHLNIPHALAYWLALRTTVRQLELVDPRIIRDMGLNPENLANDVRNRMEFPTRREEQADVCAKPMVAGYGLKSRRNIAGWVS
jgi:hypothetical protein